MFLRPQNVYNLAHDLGRHYLDNLQLYPNYAVMFDIDDTLINTKNYQGINPIIKLMKYCNKKNIIVLIITARDNLYKKETIQELTFYNIYSKYDNFYEKPKNSIFYDFIYLRNSPRDNHNLFKSDIKEELAKKHNIITIMSIGDNEVDVNGKYSGYSIKLPNKQDPRLFHKDTYGNMVEIK
jgi:predicted secreted acid phosphatase